MAGGNRPLRDRYLAWYRGVPPAQPGPPAPESGQESPARPYHNKTIRERALEWREVSGEAAFRRLYNVAAVIACLVMIDGLLLTVSALPPFGDPGNPAHNEVPRRYLEEGLADTGAVNAVAGMILDYRAFDTFGEACVLFTASCAVVLLLRGSGKRDTFDTLLHEMEEPRHDVILKQITRILSPMILMFGFYIVLGGHLGPGGGFSGGAVIGASMILFASAFGTKASERFLSYRTTRWTISAALLFYALVKGYSFFTGANHMDTGIPLGTPGRILSAGLILPLNIAVALIVACVMYQLYILFSKGEMR